MLRSSAAVSPISGALARKRQIRARVSRCRAVSVHAGGSRPAGNPIIEASVSIATRVLSSISPKAEDAPPPSPPPRSIGELSNRLEADFVEHQYFVTGDVDLGLYDSECTFADPTISFRGRERYRRNLRNLTAFFLAPKIELYSLTRPSGEPAKLKADWRLTVTLKLPWRPLIDIKGSTTYTLATSSLQVVSHVEEWSVSALQAIQQIFRSGPKA